MTRIGELFSLICRYQLSPAALLLGSGLFLLVSTSWSYSQIQPCMVQCGTGQVPCDEARNLLCGDFIGVVDIQIADPRTPGKLLTVTNIDLSLILDDVSRD